MAKRAYPKRYARAIFEIALEQNELDKWQADLSKMASLDEDAVLLTLLASPKLTFADKKKLVDERLVGVSPMAYNLAYLLMARNKMGLLKGILEQYHHLLDIQKGTLHAMVTTAIPLEPPDREKIRQSLETVIGKQIVLETGVDPAIIGGFVARINGTLLDGSTHTKLLALKRALVGAVK